MILVAILSFIIGGFFGVFLTALLVNARADEED